MVVKFTASKDDVAVIRQIVNRALAIAKRRGEDFTPAFAELDIEAVHCNGNPLMLQKFLVSPEADFTHDFCGIRRYLNKETGKLNDFFTPRCSVNETENVA